LIAKVIQNLGNLVEFGQKEPYMAPLNVFIQDSIEPMKKYIDGVSVKIALFVLVIFTEVCEYWHQFSGPCKRRYQFGI
jgi:hypothetical protein